MPSNYKKVIIPITILILAVGLTIFLVIYLKKNSNNNNNVTTLMHTTFDGNSSFSGYISGITMPTKGFDITFTPTVDVANIFKNNYPITITISMNTVGYREFPITNIIYNGIECNYNNGIISLPSRFIPDIKTNLMNKYYNDSFKGNQIEISFRIEYNLNPTPNYGAGTPIPSIINYIFSN